MGHQLSNRLIELAETEENPKDFYSRVIAPPYLAELVFEHLPLKKANYSANVRLATCAIQSAFRLAQSDADAEDVERIIGWKRLYGVIHKRWERSCIYAKRKAPQALLDSLANGYV